MAKNLSLKRNQNSQKKALTPPSSKLLVIRRLSPYFWQRLTIFLLFVLLLTQTFLMFYFYKLHTIEKNAIDEYQEALRFILREGGGFNYAICTEYITPNDPQVQSLAQQLKAPEATFDYVANQIKYRFEVTEDLLYPFVILNKGYSNCVGQANLLASLLLAKGFPPKDVRVVYGSIVLNKNRGNHAWVEFYYNNKWIVLDPTLLTQYKGFEGYEKSRFYSDYQVIPVICYNNQTKYFVSY